jgi:hypothetical protein
MIPGWVRNVTSSQQIRCETNLGPGAWKMPAQGSEKLRPVAGITPPGLARWPAWVHLQRLAVVC